MEVKLEASWKELLKDEFSQPYFEKLVLKVKRAYQENPSGVFPKPAEIFRALDCCPVDQVKVVVLGQDPYPTKGHANGLCFSINPDVRPFAKSLTNIFKEIASDIGTPLPPNGDLTRWANQGVLLLNSILTVEEGAPLSHKGFGWEKFTDAIIHKLAKSKEGIVFMLWGQKAIDKLAGMDLSGHLVLTSVHPSPLSAHRGFFGCKHFSQANAFLTGHGKERIQW